jgi:hypothetical protein
MFCSDFELPQAGPDRGGCMQASRRAGSRPRWQVAERGCSGACVGSRGGMVLSKSILGIF